MTRLLTLLALAALVGCDSRPTVTFYGDQCTAEDTGERRDRHIPGHWQGVPGKGGFFVAGRTVHEKEQHVACSGTRWVRR